MCFWIHEPTGRVGGYFDSIGGLGGPGPWALLQGQLTNGGIIANALIREQLEVTGNHSRLLELLRQASQA